MPPPRPIEEGCTYHITRVVKERVFRLRPDRNVVEAFKYLLAVAAWKYRIGVVAVLVMSNHYHAILIDSEGRLPEFMQWLHSMTARYFKCARGVWENFWKVEQTNLNLLVETSDVLDKSVYVLANPVRADLVDRAIHWPGLSSYAWLDGRTVIARRPKRFFFSSKSRLPECVPLKLTQPPGFEGTFAEWAERVREGVAAKERKYAQRRLRAGKRILGRKRVRKTPCTHAPKTRPPEGKLRPFIAAKNPEARAAALRKLACFRAWYAFAKQAFKAGWRDFPFPPGTWLMVRLAGVSVAPS